MNQDIARESMAFDVVIVGGGPAGLATAIRLRQRSLETDSDLQICLVEKGSEIGSHIISGAVLEPRALNELMPDWQDRGAPVTVPVTEDRVYFLLNERRALRTPNPLVPGALHNKGNYIISLGNLCRWLGQQAEELGVMMFPGFGAKELLYDDAGAVTGVATGDMGIGRDGDHKPIFQPGYELRARYTVLAEGCRGQLGKQLIERFGLNPGSDPQHYGIGLKEIWQITPEKHHPGLVVHAAGWPIWGESGGSFMYHAEDNQVFVGLIVDLAYSNPHLSPFDEFQRMKHHPVFADTLRGGTRLTYGARAIIKGGVQALPKMAAPGVLLVGDDAGTLNTMKIKGNHTAMKSGMVAAEVLFEALSATSPSPSTKPLPMDAAYRQSWAWKEMHRARNFAPAMHKFGTLFGSVFTWIDQVIGRGRLPFTLRDRKPDHSTLLPAERARYIEYPKPDGELSFDKTSSVYLSNTNHEEDQPCHLLLSDPETPLRDNLPIYNEPAQRYCPVGVYEVIGEPGEQQFQINAQNCIHCKTCDIKDPAQNITWICPEGGGGPNYTNM